MAHTTKTGHDTTSMLLTSALYFLSRHPAALAKVVAEVDRFGRKKQVTSEDLEAFPYIEVSERAAVFVCVRGAVVQGCFS